MIRIAIVALIFALTFGIDTVAQAQVGDPRVADLVKAGKVRVGLFATQFIKDPKTGALSGVWAESARALAARIGIPLVLIEHATPPEAIGCLKSEACDLLFLPLDDRAASVGDFSPPIFQFDYTLMVPGDSKLRTIAGTDQPGIRISAVRNHASANALVRRLKHAELVYAETPDPTFELLRTGQVAAMASARNTLLTYASRLPGARVLEDRYGANVNRIVVAKGMASRLAYVGEFVEEAKAFGLVQKAIDSAGPRGVTVAPPGDAR